MPEEKVKRPYHRKTDTVKPVEDNLVTQDNSIVVDSTLYKPIVDRFEIESTGITNYNISNIMDLKAQIPFRMNPNDIKTINVGLTVHIPNDAIGLIVSDGQMSVKNQVGVLGGPIMLMPGSTQEINVVLKNFGNMFKIYNLGDTVAKLVLVSPYGCVYR